MADARSAESLVDVFYQLPIVTVVEVNSLCAGYGPTRRVAMFELAL